MRLAWLISAIILWGGVAPHAKTVHISYFRVYPSRQPIDSLGPVAAAGDTVSWIDRIDGWDLGLHLRPKIDPRQTEGASSDTFNLFIYARIARDLYEGFLDLGIDTVHFYLGTDGDSNALPLQMSRPDTFHVLAGQIPETKHSSWSFSGLYIPPDIDTVRIVFSVHAPSVVPLHRRQLDVRMVRTGFSYEVLDR